MLLGLSTFIDALPNFASACRAMHTLLLPVTALLSIAGITLAGSRVARQRSQEEVEKVVVRMSVVAVLLVFLGTFGDALNDGVRDLVTQTGLNASGANPGNAFEAYRSAIAKKWGTDSAAIGQQKVYDAARGHEPIQATPGMTNSGAHMTHYGYDGDPDGDHYSGNYPGEFTGHGIGNHENTLVAGRSLAISQDIAQQYGLQIGETVSLTLANGQNLTGTYDDTPGKDENGQLLTGIVDLYDPQNQYGSLSGTGVTGLNGLGVQADSGTGTGFLGWVQNLGQDALNVALWGPLIYFVSALAAGVMWLMTLVQQVLYYLEIAVSPLFIGMLMVPALVPMATRFFLSLVALCCWPIGWAVCDLVTKALIDLALNPTRNTGQGMAALTGLGVGVWLLLAAWVLVSSFLAPLLIGMRIMSGHSGVSTLLGATAGATLAGPAQASSLYRSMVLGASAVGKAGNAALNIGNGISAFPPPAGDSVPNFARKPKASLKP